MGSHGSGDRFRPCRDAFLIVASLPYLILSGGIRTIRNGEKRTRRISVPSEQLCKATRDCNQSQMA